MYAKCGSKRRRRNAGCIRIYNRNYRKILNDNKDTFMAEIANDNSEGQIVLSGKNSELEKLIGYLKENKIKNIKLPVSAPFHCSLMKMRQK